MAKIITATNFSDVANQAVNYACQLASEQGASVTVFHSYFVPVTTTYSDATMPLPVIPIEEASNIAEETMAAFMAKLSATYPSLELSHKILYGNIIDGLQEYIEDEALKPWIIVLGNNGDADLWLGSNVLDGLRNLSSPTLAIPAGTTYKPVKKICFACDYKQEKHSAIATLISLQKDLQAELHILNINHDNEEGGDAANIKAIQNLLAPASPVYHFVENVNTDEAIQNFINTNHMDWLVVIPHKHSFFEGLFHKSHTKAMVQAGHTPLLALHEIK